MSADACRALGFAEQAAEGLGHRHIGTEHLLLGILREGTCLAAELLIARGLQLDVLLEQLKKLR